jgi:hypothetical protein
MSLQSVIVNQVIPGLSIVDLLQIQNVLQATLTEKVRNILRQSDTDLFEFEISRITSYKSINLTPEAVNFVNNFSTNGLVPTYVEDQLLALLKGETTIILTHNELPEVTIYIYPTKNAINIFNGPSTIQFEQGHMLLRGLECDLPYLSFIVCNLSKILL